MKDPALCRKVLETLLQAPIGELSNVDSEKTIKQTKDGHAIRMDIYAAEEDDGSIYDAEMQNLNHDSPESLCLPKRSRYYQAMLDEASLKVNSDYRTLRDTNIIFICTFDPFREGHWRYDYTEICEQNTSLKLKSGTRKTFINTTSEDNSIPENTRYLLNYINSGEVSDKLTEDLEMALDTARMDSELKAEYMRTQLALNDAKRWGENEGISAGMDSAYYTMYLEGDITKERAMEKMGLDEKAFEAYRLQYENQRGTVRWQRK